MGSDGDYPGAQVLAPGDQIGDYLIDSVLGRGGFGVVYAARQQETGAEVAIKVLSLARDAAVVQRFVAAASAADALGHRAIVDLKGFGQLPDGTSFVVSEHLNGEPLSALIEREVPMQPVRVVEILAEIASALGRAHHSGIAHRGRGA
jgi:serine/threonine-protein kinase